MPKSTASLNSVNSWFSSSLTAEELKKFTECTDELFNVEWVHGTRRRVQSHANCSSSHTCLVAHVRHSSRRSNRIAVVDGLAHEVGEVERIADERCPAEQVGQTENDQGARHTQLRTNRSQNANKPPLDNTWNDFTCVQKLREDSPV